MVSRSRDSFSVQARAFASYWAVPAFPRLPFRAVRYALYSVSNLQMVTYYRRYGTAEGWVVKADIRHFFASIDHRRLKRALKRLFCLILGGSGLSPFALPCRQVRFIQRFKLAHFFVGAQNVNSNGSWNNNNCSNTYGIRPALMDREN